jgi:Transmembrane secretion effector
MSLFNIMVQELAPDWVRARVLAVYLFVFQGSVAVGSTLWGYIALHANVHRALVFAAIGTAGCLSLQFLLRLPSVPADLSAWNHWGKLTTFAEPDPGQGPVLVTVKYVIDPVKASKFLHLIHQYQDTYLETFKVDSWAEHARQHDRFTVADREIENQVLGYAIQPVEIKHFIYARDGLPPTLPKIRALSPSDR